MLMDSPCAYVQGRAGERLGGNVHELGIDKLEQGRKRKLKQMARTWTDG